MSNVSIDRQAIARLTRDIQREFDKHPIRVPIHADRLGLRLGDSVREGNTVIYNGPVIHGNADGAQLAWNNSSVSQTQEGEQVAPGFEAIAQAVAKTLERLPEIGLAEEDLQDATEAARDVLSEVTRAEPDRGKIRRAISSLKGYLAPIATGFVTGVAAGAHDWARMAIEQLGRPF